jgi:hypothetical protein
MEKRMTNQPTNQPFDSGIFCFQLPGLVMLATGEDALSVGAKKSCPPRDFCTWHFSAKLPFANTEFAAYDDKR